MMSKCWPVLLVAALVSGCGVEGLLQPAGPRAEPDGPPVEISVPPWRAAGAESPVVPDLAANGIPSVAHRAYVHAANRLAEQSGRCGVDWALIAAIGRVETDHGRFGGSQLRADGTTSRPIRGIALDGSNGTARIVDTDGGRLDGDAVFDRAVGPMQFIPSTWKSTAAGGNPDNIGDGAVAAGRYLCGGGSDLRTEPGQRAAVFRYNNSGSYVDLVLRIAAKYRAGGGAVLPDQEPAPGTGDHSDRALAAARPPIPEAAVPIPAASGEPLVEQVDPAPTSEPVPEPTPGPAPEVPEPVGTVEETPVPEPITTTPEPLLPDPSELPPGDVSVGTAALAEDPGRSAGPTTEQPTDTGVPETPQDNPTQVTVVVVVIGGKVELPGCRFGELREGATALHQGNVDAGQRLDVSRWLADGEMLAREGCSVRLS